MTFDHLWLLFPVTPLIWWAMFNSQRSIQLQLSLNGIGAVIVLGSLLFTTSFRDSTAAAAVLLDALAGLSDLDIKPRRESA